MCGGAIRRVGVVMARIEVGRLDPDGWVVFQEAYELMIDTNRKPVVNAFANLQHDAIAHK